MQDSSTSAYGITNQGTPTYTAIAPTNLTTTYAVSAGSPITVTVGGGGSGGAPGQSNAANGGAGGSGVVIISVPTASYSGTTTGSPTITTSGSNTIIKWTTAGSGTYTA